MMIQAVLGNPHHPEYGVATIPFPIPRDQYAHCMELLEALEIGDAVKADCKVEKIDSFYTVLKRVEMLTVNVEELNYLAKRLDSFDTGEAAQFQAMAHKLELFELKDTGKYRTDGQHTRSGFPKRDPERFYVDHGCEQGQPRKHRRSRHAARIAHHASGGAKQRKQRNKPQNKL